MQAGRPNALSSIGFVPRSTSTIDAARTSATVEDTMRLGGTSARHRSNASIPLTPPPAPRSTFSERTASLYRSLSNDIQQVLGDLAQRAPKVNWSGLNPSINLTEHAPEPATQVQQAQKRAIETIEQLFANVECLSNPQDLLTAFLRLRLQGQFGSAQTAQTLSDMAADLRRTELKERDVLHRQAQVHLENALKKQEHYEKVELYFNGVAALTSSALALVMAGTGPGLALTGTAIALGFVGGGLKQDAQGKVSFNLNHALQGASTGAMLTPLSVALRASVVSAAAVVFGGVAGGLWGARGEDYIFDYNSALKGAAIGAISVPMAEGLGMLAKSFAAASRAAIAGPAGGGIRAYGQNVAAAFSGALSQSLNRVLNLPESRRIFGGKRLIALEMVTQATLAGQNIFTSYSNYRVQREELHAQRAFALGQSCTLAAQIAQKRWRNTQDFISMLQEWHSDGVRQAMLIINLHHQSTQRAISHLLV